MEDAYAGGLLMEQTAAGHEEPAEDDFGGFASGVDLALEMEVVIFALHADGDELLVEAVVL